MKDGDRVLIVKSGHPYHGHTGTIRGDWFVPGLLVGRMIRVEIDNSGSHMAGLRDGDADVIIGARSERVAK